jgi:hypothetical protein
VRVSTYNAYRTRLFKAGFILKFIAKSLITGTNCQPVKQTNMKINPRAEALIIAEITGSITSEESAELAELRNKSSAVKALSEGMHMVLDPDIVEISKVMVTAEQIIDKGNAQLAKMRRVKGFLARMLKFNASK